MRESHTEISPPDHAHGDGDGDGDENVQVSVAIVGSDDIYRAATAVLDPSAPAGTIAAELIGCLRALAVQHSPALAVEVARKLAP